MTEGPPPPPAGSSPSPLPARGPFSEDGAAYKAALKEYRAELLDHRKWLRGVDYNSSKEFDRVLTTLSATALGLTVTLGRNESSPWLDLGQAAFTLSLLTMVFSYLTARRDFKGEFRGLDEALAETDARLRDMALAPSGRPGDPHPRVSTTFLNRLALALLLVGLCMLMGLRAGQ